jgi:phosphoglycerol transferase
LTLLGAGVVYWRHRSGPALKSALAVIGAAAAAFALMNLDTWTYRLAHGPNPGALSREYKWMEIYGLKLVDLVIPPITHHSQTFAAFATAHRVGNPAQGIPPASPLQDEGSYLGIVGLLALGWLAWTAIADAVKGRANDIPLAAWQVLWIVLCFTTGGLNAILGVFGFTLFRTGQRYSLVILAIVLLYAAQRMTAWQKAAASHAGPGGVSLGGLAAAAAICGLVLWDQVPRAPAAEVTAAIARQVAADREFTAKMEAVLPKGAMVFQLPVMDFPESPQPGIPSYDHFRPYLYSSNLRYSFGSMKGREREKWQAAVQGKFFEAATLDREAGMIRVNQANARAAVDELKRLGFAAIYINRNGFPDRGKGIEEALLDMGYAKPPIRNATGDLACIVLEK